MNNNNNINHVTNQVSLHFQNNPTSAFNQAGQPTNNNNSSFDYTFPGQTYLDELEQRMYNYSKPF